jgi:hypothetical protein
VRDLREDPTAAYGTRDEREEALSWEPAWEEEEEAMDVEFVSILCKT